LTPRRAILILARMSEKPKPALSDRGKADAAERQERLAAALRDNLRRRKQQARVRKAAAGATPSPREKP
jgi:hypothetical protein